MHQPAMGLRLELQQERKPHYEVRMARSKGWVVWDRQANKELWMNSRMPFDSYDAAEQFAEKLNRESQ